MKTVLLFALLFLQPDWTGAACGIVYMNGLVLKSPHKMNIPKLTQIKIEAFGNGSFYIGMAPRLPKTREEAIELLQQSDCASAYNVTDIENLTCELEPGTHYFLLVTPQDNSSAAKKIAYQIYVKP